MKVPGRKSVVRKAMIFIAELSCLLAAASSLESLARPMLTSVSACAMRLNSCICKNFARMYGFVTYYCLLSLQTACDIFIYKGMLITTQYILQSITQS